MSLLTIQDVTKEFTVRKSLTKGDIVRALDDVTLELREKELLGIVGASGSGKSTLARLMVLLYRPTSGKIIFDNEDVSGFKGKRLKNYRKNIQMVFQDPYASLDPFHNVEWHIKRPLLINHYKGNVNDRVQELLTQVKLDPPSQFLDKFPHQISGGQRQRVYMARALATEPKVLIADEPVSMLDVSLRIEILELLLSLRENLGISIIYITHDLNTVSMITDRIYVLNKGKVVEFGDTKQVIENPVDEYTRRLIKAAPDPFKKIEVD